MQVIYKYQFFVSESFKLWLSPDSKTLKIDVRNGVPTMWILVDPDNLTRETEFRIVGTGQPIDFIDNGPKSFFHAGSVFEDFYVWHVFQEV